MADIRDIWKDGEGKLPEDKFMAYLEGRLTPEEQHEVEAWLAAEGMEADALEGLKALPATETKQLVSNINQHLHTRLKKDKRRHKPIAHNQWAWIAVIIVLLLCVLGYVVFRTANKKTLSPVINTKDTMRIQTDSYVEPAMTKFEPKFQFSDFKVDDIYIGNNHPVDLKSNITARRYRTRIRQTYETDGVSFGGHYCFVYWGCGSPCQMSAIVDVKTGKVYDGPTATLGYEYQANSRMIIVNPLSENDIYHPQKGYYLADCPYCIPEIWVWNEQKKKFEQKQ